MNENNESITDKWTSDNYKKYIVDNNLDKIWYDWCNPDDGSGIRVSAFTPIYSQEIINREEKKCTKLSCKDGTYRIPEDSHNRKVIYRKICDVCRAKKSVMYRWVSQWDKTKIWFNDPLEVIKYGNRGRTFYATLTIYDRNIVSPKGMYIDESLIKAHTLGMDIDINEGTICDKNNRESIDKVLDIIREHFVSAGIENSYSLQSSGNGVYVYLHHSLCTNDIRYTCSMYNSWIKYINKLCKSKGINNITIDPINMMSRVYKLMGSIHQKYDLVAIPLDFDGRLDKMASEEFKLKYFSVQNFLDEDGKISFYNRVRKNEKNNLYKYLEEHSVESELSNLRAYRHTFANTGIGEIGGIGVEAITNEQQMEQIDIQTSHIGMSGMSGMSGMKKDLRQMSDDELKYYVGWKKFDTDISGKVIYKNRINNRKVVEMIGVKNPIERIRILDDIWKRENEEGKEGKEGKEGRGK